MIKFITNGSSLEVKNGGEAVLLFTPMKNIAFTSLELYEDIPTISLYNINVGLNERLFSAPLSQVADNDGNFFTVDSFLTYASLNFGMTPTESSTPSSGAVVMANGTYVNFGASGGGADILGGSSVDWGVEQNSSSDHFPFLVVPFKAKIKAIGIQWGSTIDYQTARGSSTVTFKVSGADFGTDVTDVNNWSVIGTLTTELDGTSGASPGFLEEVDFQFDSNLIQVTAVATSGFSNTGEEVEITVLIEQVV
jgi:hypothetical protein